MIYGITATLTETTRNLKTYGPSAGPRKGAIQNRLIASPTSLGPNMSATFPPALASGEEPIDPAKKRKINKDVILFAPAAPPLKTAKAAKVVTKMIWRP